MLAFHLVTLSLMVILVLFLRSFLTNEVLLSSSGMREKVNTSIPPGRACDRRWRRRGAYPRRCERCQAAQGVTERA